MPVYRIGPPLPSGVPVSQLQEPSQPSCTLSDARQQQVRAGIRLQAFVEQGLGRVSRGLAHGRFACVVLVRDLSERVLVVI